MAGQTGYHRGHITSETQLAEICRQTLVDWPEAKAAVLFGSRARGDHRPDSDWDVALIVEGTESIDRSDLFREAGVDNVDLWTVDRDWAACDEFYVGSLATAIALDGKVLAGRWKIDQPEKLNMDPTTWQQDMLTSLVGIENALQKHTRLAEKSKWISCLSECTDFVKNSADAAEHLVKAMIGRRGIQPKSSHDIQELVEGYVLHRQIIWPKILHEGGKDEVAAEHELIRQMRRLNGQTKLQQQGNYSKDTKGNLLTERVLSEGSIAAAIDRLVLLPEMHLSELKANPDDGAMAKVIPILHEILAETILNCLEYLATDLVDKPDEDSLARYASETILASRGRTKKALEAVQVLLSGP